MQIIVDQLNMLLKDEDYRPALYEGVAVILNKVEINEYKYTKYVVYAETTRGDIVCVRFGYNELDYFNENTRRELATIHKCDILQDRSTPSYWVCKLISIDIPKPDIMFAYDSVTGTLTSVRDGTQLYQGFELNSVLEGELINPNRSYSIYRSPETISNLMGLLKNIPITINHIENTDNISKHLIKGYITSSELVEYNDKDTDTTSIIRNSYDITDTMLIEKIKTGQLFLSLGYIAKIRKIEGYDFEQYDVIPNHLAIVDNARGGHSLKFNDKKNSEDAMVDAVDKTTEEKQDELPPIFNDVEGVTLKMIERLGEQFNATLRDAPLNEINKIARTLIDWMASMGVDYNSTEIEVERNGEGYESMGMEDTMNIKDESKSEVKKFTDATMFNERYSIIEKAKSILPDTLHSFADMSNNAIMSKVISFETGKKFADEDLKGAFAILKAPIIANIKVVAFNDDKKVNEFDILRQHTFSKEKK